MAADLILTASSIITMDASQTRAEAIAVNTSTGVITSICSLQEVCFNSAAITANGRADEACASTPDSPLRVGLYHMSIDADCGEDLSGDVP
ncbi:MAG: hypothetical protein QG597_3081 [Actinomycetota bacterium]|nr:hypothetical protein [Actinomycetota bacterium]